MILYLPNTFFRDYEVPMTPQIGVVNAGFLIGVFENVEKHSLVKFYWESIEEMGRVTIVNAFKKARFDCMWFEPVDEEKTSPNGGGFMANNLVIGARGFCNLMDRMGDETYVVFRGGKKQKIFLGCVFADPESMFFQKDRVGWEVWFFSEKIGVCFVVGVNILCQIVWVCY